MLARTLGPKFDLFPCYVQPKLNGIRALYQSGTFQSRGEKLWKPSFFPHIVEQLQSLDLPPNTILDGEFYVHGWRLGRILSATGVNNNDPNTDTPSIVYNVFDVVEPNKGFRERVSDLVIPFCIEGEHSNISLVPTGIAHDRAELDAYFKQFIADGYEGLMARPEGNYEFGATLQGTEYRSRTLWKHKKWADMEFICVGVTHGEGKASIGAGSLILRTEGGETFHVNVLGDEERIKHFLNPPIGHLVRVRYNELTALGIPVPAIFVAVLEKQGF